MDIIVTLVILFIVSLFLAIRSMKDVGFSQEIERSIRKNKIKGTIVFFKDRIKHY